MGGCSTAALSRPRAPGLLRVALRRPLTSSAPVPPLQDMAELESAVGASLVPAEAVGSPLRALRALRRLLFTETPDVRGSAWAADLPRPALLHHLYSRAPAALESPHVRSGLTPAQVGLTPAPGSGHAPGTPKRVPCPALSPPPLSQLHPEAASCHCQMLACQQPPHAQPPLPGPTPRMACTATPSRHRCHLARVH